MVKGGSPKSIESKKRAGINVIGSIYEDELELSKEIGLHSWGKPSIVDGDSHGDLLLIGGPSL